MFKQFQTHNLMHGGTLHLEKARCMQKPSFQRPAPSSTATTLGGGMDRPGEAPAGAGAETCAGGDGPPPSIAAAVAWGAAAPPCPVLMGRSRSCGDGSYARSFLSQRTSFGGALQALVMCMTEAGLRRGRAAASCGYMIESTPRTGLTGLTAGISMHTSSSSFGNPGSFWHLGAFAGIRIMLHRTTS